MSQQINLPSKLQENFEPQFDSLIAPERVSHEDARTGSVLLLELPKTKKFEVFHALFFTGQKTDVIAGAVVPTESDDREHKIVCLVAALRRLSIVGAGLAEKVRTALNAGKKKNTPDEKSDAEEPASYSLSFKPGILLSDHLKYAEVAPKDYDCVAKMASLTALLEAQLGTLYAHPTRNANPFMLVRDVNMAAGTYMGALNQLHKMQMDVGIVEKTPEKMEVNLNQAGAFQSYIGELQRDHKQAMIDFANDFCRYVKDKEGAVSEQK